MFNTGVYNGSGAWVSEYRKSNILRIYGKVLSIRMCSDNHGGNLYIPRSLETNFDYSFKSI